MGHVGSSRLLYYYHYSCPSIKVDTLGRNKHTPTLVNFRVALVAEGPISPCVVGGVRSSLF